MLSERLQLLIALLCVCIASAAGPQPVYFGHEPVEDAHGVVAPWYAEQNGQFDERVRIAAETLKRYPWTTPGEAPVLAPHYVYNGEWRITREGEISIPQTNDWNNGDQSQRIAFILSALVDYYRYTGDAAAMAHITITADTLLKLCLTPPGHPWPSFPVSVPVKGKPYGQVRADGYIQTDIAAEVGLALLRAYQVTGRQDWFDMAKHWGDLFVQYCGTGPGGTPWSRYANPEAVPWSDKMTGGVSYILFFLDELIRLGYTGDFGSVVEARDAGVAYLHDVLLPKWTEEDTWGRNFWDWECNVQCEYVTTFTCRYIMSNPDKFPNWRNDVRNIATLFINHTAVSRSSRADVYSGAWAYPESAGCCGRSLWYPPQEVSTVFAEWGVRADSEWGREIARRQQLLSTYDYTPTGYVDDNIDGGQIVAGSWFKITHPMALKHILGTMAWLPGVEGPARENHIMRSTAVVKHVVYGDGSIRYETFDAPEGTEEVLRLAFEPTAVTADGIPLQKLGTLKANGYTTQPLSCGDSLVSIRHDGAAEIVVRGNDPQEFVGHAQLELLGQWENDNPDSAALSHTEEASMVHQFVGNQVRLVGDVGPDGGLADVYLDGEKQLVQVDCWNPEIRKSQVLYYRSGLSNGSHVIRLVVRGKGNPIATGKTVRILGVQFSSASASFDYGAGAGPTETQRWIFGYPGIQPLKDRAGNEWVTAAEFIVRAGDMADSVKETWWKESRADSIEGSGDPAPYQYGAHGRRLTAHVTVGPGTYYARLKFAETRQEDRLSRAFTISINDKPTIGYFDIAATAGGMGKAVDLVFDGLRPDHGMITIDLKAGPGGEAILQALEVGQGDGGHGAEPVCLPEHLISSLNLLEDGGFEESVFSFAETGEAVTTVAPWTIEVLSRTECYVWSESAYQIHSDWGPPKYHGGAEALRTHSDGNGHTRVQQDVDVVGGKAYEAGVWVHAASLGQKGFGATPGDSAGFIIEERDARGQLVAAHAKREATVAGEEYVELKTTFATSSETRTVRFILDTVIAGPYAQAHVSYDDCWVKVTETEVKN